MSEQPDPKYKLADPQREAIYSARIAPLTFHKVSKSLTPTLLVVAGQPGAGKAAIREGLRNELAAKGGVAVVDQEALRAHHPQYRALAVKNDLSAATHTAPEAAAWEARALADARKRGVNVALETSGKDADRILAIVKDFKDAGYRVELRALAVPDQDSLRGLTQRYESQRSRNEPGRAVSPAEHTAGYRALPETIRRIEAESRIDRVSVVRRNGEAVYENQRVGGKWQFTPPIGDRALTMERNRARTREELQTSTTEWAALEKLNASRSNSTAAERNDIAKKLQQARDDFKKHLNLIPPPSREEATRQSLAGARAIARALGGAAAKLAAPEPGKSYRGPVLGESKEHIVQGGKTLDSFVAHSKRDLAQVPSVGAAVDVRYPPTKGQQASVTDISQAAEKAAATPARDIEIER